MAKPDYYHSPTSVFGFMFFGAAIGGIISFALGRDFGRTYVAVFLFAALVIGGVLTVIGHD